MPRKRKKPSAPPLPPVGDIGPESNEALVGYLIVQNADGVTVSREPIMAQTRAAGMAGAEIKLTEDPGKTPTRKKFREHLLDQMAKPQRYPGGEKPPLITGRQRDAGIELHDAWCRTMKSGGWLKEYVQTSPDWAAIALDAVERIWGYSDVTVHIPRHCYDILFQVCVQQIPVTSDQKMADLHEGLTAIAEGLRL